MIIKSSGNAKLFPGDKNLHQPNRLKKKKKRLVILSITFFGGQIESEHTSEEGHSDRR